MSTTKQRPKPGTECWMVEYLLDADVPQAFKDDENRDLAETSKWETVKAFGTKAEAEAFGKTLRGTWWGCYRINHMRYCTHDPDYEDIYDPDWYEIGFEECEEAR